MFFIWKLQHKTHSLMYIYILYIYINVYIYIYMYNLINILSTGKQQYLSTDILKRCTSFPSPPFVAVGLLYDGK